MAKSNHFSLTSNKPRVIIHGGAGNITRENLSPERWSEYQASLRRILRSTNSLFKKDPNTRALDAAVHAVQLFENDTKFNCAKGAVFTRSGTIELEASVMVSQGSKKRGVGVMGLTHVKSPISLAAEMLKRGEEHNGGGAQSHCQLYGEAAERLAKTWGLQLVHPSYFWTRKRWEEHKRGLQKDGSITAETCIRTAAETPNGFEWAADTPSWDGVEYLPQGTVGCVVSDGHGVIAVATSTGGITNKLSGRIGDTPTLGAGFWAEHWEEKSEDWPLKRLDRATKARSWSINSLARLFVPCIAKRADDGLPSYESAVATGSTLDLKQCHTNGVQATTSAYTMAVSGTGNGDTFLRLNAAGKIGMTSYQNHREGKVAPLGEAISWMAGIDGHMQKSAGDRWGKTGEGEGGVIGIELFGGSGQIAYDFNCGGMFRAFEDDTGEEQIDVFHEPY